MSFVSELMLVGLNPHVLAPTPSYPYTCAPLRVRDGFERNRIGLLLQTLL